MAIVDFSTYTEVDLAGELTVAAGQIDATALAIDESTYVVKDYTAAYFGDFIHRQKIHFESATYDGGSSGACNVWGLANIAAPTRQGIIDADVGLMLEMARSNTIYFLNLRTFPGNNQDFYIIPSIPETWWVEIERASTTLTCKIYSDEYSTLVDTLSVSCSATTMRYHAAVGGWDQVTADADTVTGYVASFDPEGGGAASAITKVGTATYADASKVETVAVAGISKIGTVAN